jgi:hypothetical protein
VNNASEKNEPKHIVLLKDQNLTRLEYIVLNGRSDARPPKELKQHLFLVPRSPGCNMHMYDYSDLLLKEAAHEADAK